MGNIPYYLTGYLLRLISELKQKPALCVFTVQKEVAERITASPPRMNKLAASVQFWANPEIIGFIPKENFMPAPKVDSAIIKLIPHTKKTTTIISQLYLNSSEINYYKTINVLFRQPRKTILNNLRTVNNELKIMKEEIVKKLAEIGINPQARPQNLSVGDIVKIANCFINELKS